MTVVVFGIGGNPMVFPTSLPILMVRGLLGRLIRHICSSFDRCVVEPMTHGRQPQHLQLQDIANPRYSKTSLLEMFGGSEDLQEENTLDDNPLQAKDVPLLLVTWGSPTALPATVLLPYYYQ